MPLLDDIFHSDMSRGLLKLKENAGFSDMFGDLTKAFGGKRPSEVDAAINLARQKLVKQDRITWWLRLWKLGYMEKLSQRYPDTITDEIVDRAANDYARRSKGSADDALRHGWMIYQGSDFLTQLQHYLALPVSGIRSHVFTFDDPERLMAQFQREEKQWQHSGRDAFVDPDATLLMKFPNGLGWYDLGTAYSAKEGRAMGHGGNKLRQHTGDTILSLRQTYSDAEGQPTVKPLLTFILDDHGMLGEMKSRFNAKPDSQYYNEIVALLRTPMVRGIKGGGHDPDSNFKLSDLDDETRAELIQQKPELSGLSYLFSEYGARDPRVEKLLEESLESQNIRPAVLDLSTDGRSYTIDEWENLERFLRHIGDSVVSSIHDVYSEKVKDTVEHISDEDIFNILKHLGSNEYQKVMQAMGVRPVSPNDGRYHSALKMAGDRLRGSNFYQDMMDAVSDVVRLTHAQLGTIRERIAKYVDAGWSFEGSWQYEAIGRDWNKPVQLMIDAPRLIGMVTADEEHDEDYLADIADVRAAQDWTAVRWQDVLAKRSENNLSDSSHANSDWKADEVVRGVMAQAKQDFDAGEAASNFAKRAGL